MTTPLLEAVRRYMEAAPARLHIPGHKGTAIPPVGDAARYDLTEVTGLDSLYHPEGPIAGTEARYTRLYGTSGTLLSAGGSTLCIQAMLALACAPGDKLLAARGVHTAAVNAMALLDLHPRWLYPPVDAATGLALAVTPGAVEEGLAAHPDARAVYLTSPSMFGVISDIKEIGEICRRHGVPLLVDNAHGAHLKFLSPSLHPMDLGADICCDSLHKSLPVLTGGALLHIGNPAFLSGAKERMALFGSTSPSYLILLSMDGALPYLEEQAAEDAAGVSSRMGVLAERARAGGFLLPPGVRDPFRLTLGFGGLGYSREDFAAQLARCRVEPEYLGDQVCVLMAGGPTAPGDYARMERLLELPPKGPPLPVAAFPSSPPRQALPPRQGTFAQTEPVSLDNAAGRVAGSTVTPCPPGIPLVIAGEVLTPELVEALKNSGNFRINVIKL